MSSTIQKSAILILAAGSSSRMKKVKQLLPYKNTTLLGWTIQQAEQSVVENIFCVLGANKELIEKQLSEIEVIHNPDYQNGLSTSIINGVQFIQKKEFDTVLIMLADQPHVTFKHLNNLIKTSERNPSKIIVSEYQNTLGVPAIFPKTYFNDLLCLKGDKGAKVLFEKNASNLIKIKASHNLIDIDTPEEYNDLLNT